MVAYSVDTHPRGRIYYVMASLSIASAYGVSHLLKNYATGSVATVTAYICLFFLFDRYLWKWPGINTLVDIPDFSGTWDGVLTVHSNPQPQRIKLLLRIVQRWTSINLVFDSPNIKSTAKLVGISVSTPGLTRITWVYQCEPKHSQVSPDIVESGITDLELQLHGPRPMLTGTYYSRRGHIGEFHVTKV